MGEPSHKTEGVETGEIVETRAKIIRASGPTAIPSVIQEEPTEKTRVPVRPKKARGHFVLLALGIAAFAASAALMALSITAPPATSKPVESTAEMLGMTFDSEAHAAVLRAEAIASSAMLRAAIETDAATLRDMAGDDLVFPVERGETLEVFQGAGATSSLLRIPSTAPALVPPQGAPARLDVGADGGVVAVAMAPINKQKAGVGGAIVMAMPVDLAGAKKRLAGHALHVQLVGLARPIELVPPQPRAAQGTRITVPIKLGGEVKAPALSLAAVIAVPPPDHRPLYAGYACAGFAAVMFAMFGVVVVRRRRGA